MENGTDAAVTSTRNISLDAVTASCIPVEHVCLHISEALKMP